ncbi:hypothetical protein [Bacillus manliponensis]|uniref:hypothetical protein n=1 Tax=Bacillus manliponensis TaxID=574376 RepID=UPI003517D518
MNDIKISFEKLYYENYEKEDSDVFVVDKFPEIVASEKYFDFEEDILLANKFNILDDSVKALCKLYLYEENVFILDDIETMKYSKYSKSPLAFSEEVLSFLMSSESKQMSLIFADLKLGILIGNGYFTYMSFESDRLPLVKQLCKSEGLFIRHKGKLV